MYSLIRSQVSTVTILLVLLSSTSAVEAGVKEAVEAYQKEDYSNATQLWQTEVESATTVHDSAIALNNLALSYLKLNQLDKALETSNKGLEIINSQDKINVSVYGQTLMVAGNVNDAVGNRTKAMEYWQDAKGLYQNKDLSGQVKASLNLLKGYSNEGFYNRLREELEELETLTNKIDEPQLLVRSLLAMGNGYRLIGNDTQAQGKIQQAVGIDNSIETNLALARLFRYQEEYDKAEENLNSLIAKRRDVQSEIDYQIQLEKQHLALQQKQYGEVSRIGQELMTRELPPTNKSIQWQLTNIDNLLTSTRQGQRLGGLESNILELKSQAKQLKQTQFQGKILHQLAEVYRQQNRLDLAIKTAVESLAIDPRQENYETYWLMTQAYQALGDHENAIAFNNKAVEVINRIKGDLVSNPEFQVTFNLKTRPIYDNLVALAVDRPGGGSQEDLKLARDTIESLQIVELENYFRLACLESKPKQLDAIDPKASAIYPIMLEDRIVTIASIGGELVHHQQNLARNKAQKTVADLRASFNPAVSQIKRRRLSEEVYGWLVEPFESKFKEKGIETLAFVVNGELRNLPLGAIEDREGRFLVEDYNIAIAPGLSLLDNDNSPTKLDSIVIGGLSDSRQGFTPLPGVEREVKQISQLDYKDKILFNEDFTDRELYLDLKRSKAPIVHVATHGQFSSDNEDTFILSWDQKISVDRLRNLLQSRSELGNDSEIELLVLSACETAVGDERAALGLAGIAVRSGARSTLASLWQVNDQSTATLMSNFYQELQTGTNRAKALREAQLELIKDGEHSHPYYWASFVMVGNWI